MSTELTQEQFTTKSIQVVAIFHAQAFPGFDAGKTVRTVLTDFAALFDGQMQVLPFGQNVPAEVPRVILQSADEAWSLHASPAQLACIWTSKSEGIAERDDELFRVGSDVAAAYLEKLKISAGRLGGVIQRFAPCSDPAQKLIRHFCSSDRQESPFNRSTAFEVHNHKTYSPTWKSKTFSVNSWVRCQTSPGENLGVVVLQDINTIPDGTVDAIEANELSDYFAMVPNEAETILRRYFPSED